jgi:hypothetical protein
MNRLFAILVLLSATGLSQTAIAQRHYSFEEACRLSGQTTGPCARKGAQAQETMCVQLSGNAFHENKLQKGCHKVSLAHVFDNQILVEMIGIQNLAKINDLRLTIARTAGIANGVALFYKSAPGCQCGQFRAGKMASGSRMIVFDPEWAATRTAEVYLIMAHEAGHHFCRHSLGQDPLNRKTEEIEADQFAGASIRRFEIYHGRRFLDDALKAASRLYRAEGNRRYAGRAERIEAIKLGYNQGSPCGNFAPPLPGFTSGPR